MARILVMALSNLAIDPRVDRQLRFLGDSHKVVAAGLAPPTVDCEFVELTPYVPPNQSLPVAAYKLVQDRSARLLGRWESLYWRVDPTWRHWLGLLENVEPDLVIANDTIAVPLAFAAARGAPVIFDAHEYAPEELLSSAHWRRWQQPHLVHITQRYLPRTAGMMSVSPGIAERYERRFGIRSTVVTNAPFRADLAPTPVSDPVRMVHVGLGGAERRIEETIAAFRHVPGDATLDLYLVGSEDNVERLRRLAAPDERIRFPAPVPIDQVVATLHAYDVGVFLLPPDGPQQLFTLPNKLFQYVQARLAVAIGPSPDMAGIVRQHGFGVVSEGFSADSFSAALRSLTPARIAEFKARAHVAADTLSAEANRDVLLDLVDRVLASRARVLAPMAG